jgi:hypothetical protein
LCAAASLDACSLPAAKASPKLLGDGCLRGGPTTDACSSLDASSQAAASLLVLLEIGFPDACSAAAAYSKLLGDGCLHGRPTTGASSPRTSTADKRTPPCASDRRCFSLSPWWASLSCGNFRERLYYVWWEKLVETRLEIR